MNRPYFADRLLDRREVAPEWQTLQLMWFVNGVLWGDSQNTPAMRYRPSAGENTFWLNPMQDGRDDIRVTIRPLEPIGPWQFAEIHAQINGYFWCSRRPLAWWAAEPTAQPTGFARWQFSPYEPGGDDIHMHLSVRRA